MSRLFFSFSGSHVVHNEHERERLFMTAMQNDLNFFFGECFYGSAKHIKTEKWQQLKKEFLFSEHSQMKK
jgi:hypothetical protein